MTTPEKFLFVKNAMIAAGFTPAQAEVTFVAGNSVSVTDKEIAEKIVKLTDMLEELDDVQEVYTNADIAEKLMEEL